GCVAVAAKVVGEGIALGTLSGKFFLAQGDQAVLFLLDGVLVQRLFAHGRRVFPMGHGRFRAHVQVRLAHQVCDSKVPAGQGRAGGMLLPCYRPCFRLASRNWSRSPSSTASQLLSSTPVRRSLMRDWSST